jgi:hypothetical protein
MPAVPEGVYRDSTRVTMVLHGHARPRCRRRSPGAVTSGGLHSVAEVAKPRESCGLGQAASHTQLDHVSSLLGLHLERVIHVERACAGGTIGAVAPVGRRRRRLPRPRIDEFRATWITGRS